MRDLRTAGTLFSEDCGCRSKGAAEVRRGCDSGEPASPGPKHRRLPSLPGTWDKGSARLSRSRSRFKRATLREPLPKLQDSGGRVQRSAPPVTDEHQPPQTYQFGLLPVLKTDYKYETDFTTGLECHIKNEKIFKIIEKDPHQRIDAVWMARNQGGFDIGSDTSQTLKCWWSE
ncbi:uncharacterized protein LOC144233372 [Crocuta crocuta]